MPRKAAGARIYQRPDTGIFVIRDTGHPERSTGTRDRRDAEKALSAYIANKGTVSGASHPSRLAVSDMLLIYGREHAPGRAAPERIGYAIQALLPFWGGLNASDIKAETCRRYCAQRQRVLKDGTVRPISNGTLRRELNVLQAAANHCHKEGYLTTSVKVALPEKPPARDRWLTRNEVARLIRSARRTSKGRHLARFILLSIYTGTRKTAVLGLGFVRNTTGGWIDLEHGVMYRRGTDERETAKLRKPVKLPRKLLAHCRRWRANGAIWAVEVDGARVGDIQTAFDGARRHAGLEDVSPHILKHTAITWAMQRGMKIETAADYFATSAETIRATYYHHSPEYQDDAVAIMDRKR